jgi:hypothetical protein
MWSAQVGTMWPALVDPATSQQGSSETGPGISRCTHSQGRSSAGRVNKDRPRQGSAS